MVVRHPGYPRAGVDAGRYNGFDSLRWPGGAYLAYDEAGEFKEREAHLASWGLSGTGLCNQNAPINS